MEKPKREAVKFDFNSRGVLERPGNSQKKRELIEKSSGADQEQRGGDSSLMTQKNPKTKTNRTQNRNRIHFISPHFRHKTFMLAHTRDTKTDARNKRDRPREAHVISQASLILAHRQTGRGPNEITLASPTILRTRHLHRTTLVYWEHLIYWIPAITAPGERYVVTDAVWNLDTRKRSPLFLNTTEAVKKHNRAENKTKQKKDPMDVLLILGILVGGKVAFGRLQWYFSYAMCLWCHHALLQAASAW